MHFVRCPSGTSGKNYARSRSRFSEPITDNRNAIFCSSSLLLRFGGTLINLPLSHRFHFPDLSLPNTREIPWLCTRGKSELTRTWLYFRAYLICIDAISPLFSLKVPKGLRSPFTLFSHLSYLSKHLTFTLRTRYFFRDVQYELLGICELLLIEVAIRVRGHFLATPEFRPGEPPPVGIFDPLANRTGFLN